MRLNKYIGDTGYCSRREADRLITARRVSINGQTAGIGVQVQEGDKVRVDGELVRARTRGGSKVKVYIALNKPVGVTCTTEASVRGNIIDFVGHPERIFPIGRLDKDSEGLILLTNDGDIVNEVLRAEHGHEKEYVVSVEKPITDAFIRGMAAGVAIHNTRTLPCKVHQLGKASFRIVLTQGLNRQIRLMCAAFGYEVRTLQRVRIMHIRLGRLEIGRWRNLTAPELQGLIRSDARETSGP